MKQTETTKRTAIKVRGAEDITLSSPKGTMSLEYVDGKLRAKGSRKVLNLVPERMAEIAEAVAAYRPPSFEEQVSGRYASSEAAWRAGDTAETFRVQREELSSGPQVIDEGTGEIVVMIGREDMA